MSRIRPVIQERPAEGPAINAPGFPLPFGRRHSLLGHPIPARELGLPCGRLTGHHLGSGPPTGLPRSTRTSCDRDGCLLYPGDGDAHPADLHSPAGACRFPAASPCTPLLHPISGAADHEASTEVHAIHPSGLPLACGPRMKRAPSGFFPELRTPPTHHRRRTSEWGQAIEHEPGTTLPTSADPPIR
jgi:hypothetical protein